MLIQFWGVRGSIPTCITSQEIQKKISAVVQRITPEDLKSEDSRQRFVAKLPDYLFGTVGGNTPCVQIISNAGKHFILDAGSGLRVLGKRGELPEDKHFNFFFSHFHWDHIQGLPFFDQIYNPKYSFDFYSTFPKAKQILAEQMEKPYYPVTWNSLSPNINFHRVIRGVPFNVDGLKVSCCKMKHPGNSYSYSFTEGDKKFVYATDVELSRESFVITDERKLVFDNADAIVFDCQYTVAEAARKENWGHSAFCSAIDFALRWKIKSLYLFHHEPVYDDFKLNSILNAAKRYAKFVSNNQFKVYLAAEGSVIEL